MHTNPNPNPDPNPSPSSNPNPNPVSSGSAGALTALRAGSFAFAINFRHPPADFEGKNIAIIMKTVGFFSSNFVNFVETV